MSGYPMNGWGRTRGKFFVKPLVTPLAIALAALFAAACTQQTAGSGDDDPVTTDEAVLDGHASDGEGSGATHSQPGQLIGNGNMVMRGELSFGPHPDPWGPHPDPWSDQSSGSGTGTGTGTGSGTGTSSSSGGSGSK